MPDLEPIAGGSLLTFLAELAIDTTSEGESDAILGRSKDSGG